MPLKIRISFFSETLVFLLALVALNLIAFPDFPAYIQIQPHPYLAIVLLMASLYGSKEGIAAAFFSSAFLIIHLLLVRIPLSIGEIIKNPVLFFLGGLILGEVREVTKRKIESLEGDYHELQDKVSHLEMQYRALEMVKKELEGRIIGQTASVVSLYEATKALESLDPKKIYNSLLEITAKFIGVEQASFYLVVGEKLSLVAAYGWADSHPLPEIKMGEGVIGFVAQEGRQVTLKDLEKDPFLSQLKKDEIIPSFLVAPVKVGTRVVGVINVEKIPFIKLTPNAVRIFSMISDLASPALENALTYKEAKAADIRDDLTGLFNHRYFLHRYEEEFKRTVRYNLFFTLILMEIESQIEGEELEVFLPRAAEIIRKDLRTIDLTCRNEKENRLILLLPLTDAHGAMIVSERLKGKLEAFQLFAYFGISSFTPAIKDMETILDLARKAVEEAKEEERGAIKFLAQEGKVPL